MKSLYRFHGFAIGAAGRIEQPFSDVIEVQAATALPQIGGRASAKSAHFRFRDIVKFDLAYSEVTGSDCQDDCCGPPTSHVTHLRCVVEGLDVMSMVTADRVVANLVSTSTSNSDDEPAVRLLGTRFENLRIAGVPVNPVLATDLLDRYDTHGELGKAYKSDDAVRDLIDRPALRSGVGEAPEHMRKHFRFFEPTGEMPARRGKTYASLVRSLAPEAAVLKPLGHVIHVKGFGTVRLAEIEITQRTRFVNMIQIDFDCPYRGRVMFCEIADGGETL